MANIIKEMKEKQFYDRFNKYVHVSKPQKVSEVTKEKINAQLLSFDKNSYQVDPDYMPEELRNREIMDCQYRIDCLLKQIEERNDPIYDNPNVYDPLKSYIVSLRNRIMHLSVKVPFHSYQYIKVDYQGKIKRTGNN